MKVFISWSGEPSRDVAFALRDWLPNVLQEVRPFVSSKDIRAGTRWQEEIASELGDTAFGLICVTKENQALPWLNFEAGALAKSVDSSRVIPLAIDLTLAAIKNPLGQFQAKLLNRDDLGEVVASMNECCDVRLSAERLRATVEKWWPELEEELEEFEEKRQSGAKVHAAEPESSERELLEEVLTSVRSLSRATTKPNAPFSVEAVVTAVHEAPGKAEKRELVKPALLKRIAELRDGGQTTLTWPELVEPFPSGGGVRIALQEAFRELRSSGEIQCTMEPEPGPNQALGPDKTIRLES